MLYRLVRPVKRKDTRNKQFIRRIPSDLRERMVGVRLAIPVGDVTVPILITPQMESIRVSLRTDIPEVVKLRQAEVAAYLEKVFSAFRHNQPVPLTHRQAVALSGELYRAWASDHDSSQSITFVQGEDGRFVRDYSEDFEEVQAGYLSMVDKLKGLHGADPAELEKLVGPLVDRLLMARGIAAIDASSRVVVLREFLSALRQGMEVRARKAGGDYSPDPQAERFPEWQPQAAAKPATAAHVSLKGLLSSWWAEAKASGLSESTFESYSKAVGSLGAFLGHDDASKVTPDDVLGFKDHLLASTNANTGKPLSAKTVKDSYLSGLKSVFAWALTNRKLASNPATGITIRLAKATKMRDSWFTKQEVGAILSASAGVIRGPKEPPQRHALKRWVPWLCAYTGARVGEIVQLRKQDIRKEEGHWIITITPEAGTVKDKERRDVPLHPHLIELGFTDFVLSAPDGHLFMWSGDGRAAWRSAKNRLTAFVRAAVSDPNVQPNHGWRHTFKTVGSEAGIQDKVLDAICGHDPRTVGESYGGVTLAAKVKAMGAFPRFHIA